MKCVICNQRKGKRYCPAKNAMICAVCCGTKRVIEIDCPSDCPHLIYGREHMASEIFARQYQKSGPGKMKFWELIEKFPKLLSDLQEDVVLYRKGFRGLTDAQAREAISLLLKSYETEARGILYQHRSYKPEIQTLIERLAETIEEDRRQADRYGPITTRDIVDCLAALKDQIEFHIEENVSATGYLDFITPFHPEVNPRADRSRIIIP